MPNTPAAIGEGMTAIFSDGQLTSNIRLEVEELFGAIGEYCWIEEEDSMHLITAISGSGPAYYYLLTECLMDIATSQGLDPDIARLLVQQTFRFSIIGRKFSKYFPFTTTQKRYFTWWNYRSGIENIDGR